jgi:hypothetical protein
MQVRTMVGRLAGEIVEMPYHVATAMLANGTAIDVDAPYKPRRGVVTAHMADAEKTAVTMIPEKSIDGAAQDAASAGQGAPLPADWQSLHHKTRVRLARERGYQGPDSATDADAFLAGYKG